MPTRKRAVRASGAALRPAVPQGFHRHHENGHGAVSDIAFQVAIGVPPDVHFSKKGLSAHHCTERLASPTSPLGSWRIASVRRWAGRPRTFGRRRKNRWSPRTYYGNVEDHGPSRAKEGRAFTKSRTSPGGNAPLSLLSSVAVMSARSMRRSPISRTFARSLVKTLTASRGCTPTKASSIPHRRQNLTPINRVKLTTNTSYEEARSHQFS